MSRVIKFRGYCNEKQRFIFGGISIFQHEATIFDEDDITNSAYEVNNQSVGQFTGLKDDYDIEIYEGDIILFSSNNQKEIVEFNDDKCKFQYSDGTDINDGNRYGQIKIVIGNIFENPELLEP